MTNKYDVAILGWWHNSNYGSIMTYYALNQAILDYGYSTLLVHEALGYPSRFELPEDAPAITFAKRRGFNYTKQGHFSELSKLNEQADTFVVGSDQLWNPYISRINDDLFLNFTAPEKKRIAYGTSIGNFNRDHFQSEHFDVDFETVEKQNLERFDWISMREDDGIQYMKKTFGFDVPQVVDPVFLIDPKNYHDLADQATNKYTGNYMLAFILDPSEEKKRVVQGIADKLGFDRIVVYTDANASQIKRAKEIFNDSHFEFDNEIRSENWLNAYQNAGYVVTDSFHGSAFAYIFQKPFSSFYNKVRGTNRFASLMRLFKLDDSRRIYEENSNEDILKSENVSLDIDFTEGNKNLADQVEYSQTWLKNALSAKKRQDKVVPGATLAANTRVDENEIRDFILNHDFAWYRENSVDHPMATRMRLDKDGKIRNGVKGSANSVLWAIKNGKLEIRNANDVPTTILTPFSLGNRTFIFRGKFIPDGKTVHVLEESIHYQENNQSVFEYQPVKGDVAIPHNTPTRKTLIKQILSNPKVQELFSQLNNEIADLESYTAREMKDYTTNKVGGPADILVFPKTNEQLQHIIEFANKNRVRFTIIGKGSNIIVRDGGIRGITIVTTNIKHINLVGNTLTVSAGFGLVEVAYYLETRDKSGFEWASNIPGTIGGALYMNAGTNKSDIRSWVKTITYLDGMGQVHTVEKSELEWGKRFSTFQQYSEWTIIEATFEVLNGFRRELVDEMEDLVAERARLFPMELPSHGSTFKWWRHPRLIAQAGLTGYRVGGVQISTKQPGFFVNIDQATASDYEAVIDYTIAKVYEFSGFLLEPEVEFIGERMQQTHMYSSSTFQPGD